MGMKALLGSEGRILQQKPDRVLGECCQPHPEPYPAIVPRQLAATLPTDQPQKQTLISAG